MTRVIVDPDRARRGPSARSPRRAHPLAALGMIAVSIATPCLLPVVLSTATWAVWAGSLTVGIVGACMFADWLHDKGVGL